MPGQKRYRFGAIKPIPKRKRSKYPSAGGGPIPRSISARSGQKSVTSISRSFEMVSSTQAAATDLLAAYEFQVADLPNYTAFTALYDQYRILAVKLEFVPTTECTTYWNGSAVVNPVSPVLHTCIDLDDATSPSAAVILAHETYKCHGAFQASSASKYVRWLEPAIAVEAYQTGGFGGYISKTKQWIDAASTSVQHYGLKMWLEMPAGSPATRIQIYATYYMEFKLPF